MKKWLGKIIVTLLSLVLMAYTASRCLNFISLSLPDDKQVLAYFGLAALEGGMLGWLLAFLYGSLGGAQRGISLIMIIVDVVGTVAMFTADTLYSAGEMGVVERMPAEEARLFLLALSGIIAANVVAGIAHHITDPDNLQAMAKEEAISKIDDAARKKVEDASEALAAELAPVYAAAWVAEARARALANIQSVGALGLAPGQMLEAEYKDTPRTKPAGGLVFPWMKDTAPLPVVGIGGGADKEDEAKKSPNGRAG